ncbi:MAG: antibiotic biosynthesis monooxygenase [Proteobacteria bacterium]|nr:antibiotic biosynthesis monooxygenase [Pseudomonadota bacterium]
MSTLVIAGTITIDPARRDEVIAEARVMMQETRKEPGNVAYAFSADLDDPAVLHICEQWKSQEALDFHFATPHMAHFQKRVAELGLQGMDVKKFTVSGVGPVF